MLRIYTILSLTILLTGCTAHSFVEPIGKDRKVVRLAVGGPIVAAFDTHVPVPYAVVGMGAGINPRTNLFADVHILPLFYKIAGAEAGFQYFPLLQAGWKPTIGLGGRLMFMDSFRSNVDERFRFWPIFTLTSAWAKNNLRYYIGNDLTLPLSRLKYDNNNPSYILSPFIGSKLKIGKDWTVGLELKWQAANLASNQSAVEYTGFGGKGALATLITFEQAR